MLTRSHVASSYDAAIIDLWGVIHDGTSMYPSALESLLNLRKAGIKIILLSNAPRRAHKAREVLQRLRVEDGLYDMLLTSGEEAFLALTHEPSWLGTRYYYLGPSKDEDVLDGAEGFTRVEQMSEADFILNTGFEFDFQSQEAILPTLERLRAHDLPLLCINPDREVVKRDGTHMLCAGVVAGMYEALGGRTLRVGKPYMAVYERIFYQMQLTDVSRVLCIGDTPATDILGAHRMGMDSLLITGGVLSVSHPALTEPAAMHLCEKMIGVKPTFVLPSFSL